MYAQKEKKIKAIYKHKEEQHWKKQLTKKYYLNS